MKTLVLLLLSMLISSNSGANIDCRSDPTTDDDQQAVDDGQGFTLTCTLAGSGNANNQDHIQACSWEHYFPLNEQRTNNVKDVECVFSNAQSTNCVGGQFGDSRISGMVQSGSCNIQVSNSKPDDTGEWKATVSTVRYSIKL